MDKKEQIVFGTARSATPQNDTADYLILGVSEDAWNYMKDGKTHTLDLTRIGLPVKVIVFGAKTQQDCVDLVMNHNANGGFPPDDRLEEDFGIKPPKAN